MTGAFWLSDRQWSWLQPLLPNEPRGEPGVDDLRVTSGMVHVLHSACRWKHAPAIFGPPRRSTTATLRCAADGVSCTKFEALAAGGGAKHDPQPPING